MEGARSSGVYGAFRALPWETGARCGRARSRGADTSGAAAGVRVRVANGTAGAVREEVRILLSRHRHGCRTGSRTRGAESLASAVTMSASFVPLMLSKEQQSGRLRFSLSVSSCRQCQAVRTADSLPLALSRPPPGLWRSSRLLPPRDVPSWMRVCVCV